MRKNKLWREKIVLAKAGNEPIEIYRAKARIEGMRKHALEKFEMEDKRYLYWNFDDTPRYLRYKKLVEAIRAGNHPATVKKFFEDTFARVDKVHDAYYLTHLEYYADAVRLLHKADLEEAKLNLKGE